MSRLFVSPARTRPIAHSKTDQEQAVLVQAEGTPGVEAVTQLLTMHLGPEMTRIFVELDGAYDQKQDPERATS